MKHFIFIAWDYKGRLTEIKVKAEDKKEAYMIARDMCENSKYINIDEGVLFSSEY